MNSSEVRLLEHLMFRKVFPLKTSRATIFASRATSIPWAILVPKTVGTIRP
jgi:hypothetical protein